MARQERGHVPRLDTPEPSGARTSGHDPASVRAESRLADDRAVAAQESAHLACSGVPHPRVMIDARRNNEPSVRAEGGRGEVIAMAGEGPLQRAALEVPDRRLGVGPGSHQAAAIGAERKVDDSTAIEPWQTLVELPIADTPEAHDAIVAGGRQPFTVRTEGDREHRARVRKRLPGRAVDRRDTGGVAL